MQETFLSFLPLWALILILIWTIPWKGVALWRAAKNGHKRWFIFLLAFNTLAIFEIVYIFYFSKQPKNVSESNRGN